jgi:hypothetical protein
MKDQALHREVFLTTRSIDEKIKAAKFARAMARNEFRHHYVDDNDLAEVRRSVSRTKPSPPPESG